MSEAQDRARQRKAQEERARSIRSAARALARVDQVKNPSLYARLKAQLDDQQRRNG